MRENPRKVLSRIKRNLIESEAQKISEGLDSSNAIVIATTLNELKKLKDPLHMHRAKELLLHESDLVVTAALRYLNVMNHPISIEEIKPLLKRSAKVRKEIAKSINLMEFGQACKLLKVFLDDVSLDVRISALRSISKIGCDSLNEETKRLLGSSDPKVKIEAFKTLVELGENIENESIADMIFDVSLPDRIRLTALKLYTLNSVDPLSVLKKAANSSYSPLSSGALKLMGDMKCDDVWDFFKSVLSNRGNLPSKICSALNGASKSCHDKSELEKLAVNYLDHLSSMVRIAAFKVIMTSNGAYILDAIKDFLDSDDRYMKTVAIPFVYKYPSEENVEAVRNILKEGDEKTLVPALKVLRKLGLKEEIVKEYVDKRYPPNVRIEALKALVATKEITDSDLRNYVESYDLLKFRLTALDGLSRIAPEKLLELEERV